MASVEAYPEDSNGEAAVETVGALEGRYEERHLAVGYRRQLKERTQDDGVFRKELAATRRRTTSRAIPARRKKRSHKGPTVEKSQLKMWAKNYIVRGAPKGRTFEKYDGSSSYATTS
jgi:hypothetical protein